MNKADWERRTRAANACRRAFMGQTYYPQPALWKVADSDTTIYLLGTAHRLPTGFEWRNAQLDEIIRQSGSLVTESGPLTNAQSAELEALFVPPSGASRTWPPIIERLDGERRAKWIGMASVLPRSAVERMDRMPNWLAAMSIGSAVSRSANPLGTIRGVDDQLKAEFTRARKPVGAMEDPKAVVAAVNNMPETVQIKMLHSVMDAVGQPRQAGQGMAKFHRWARGEAPLTDDDLAEFPIELRKQLLDARNAAWVGVVKQKLGPPGTTLIAVGAAHLHGPASLLDLLEKEGVRADRISPTTPPRPRPEFKPNPKSLQECQNYMFGKAVPQAGAD